MSCRQRPKEMWFLPIQEAASKKGKLMEILWFKL
jgi:hypothetical protein